MLDNQYLLKKDTILMMPNEAIHSDASIWGNPQDFDPQRFTKSGGKLPGGAFRAFGGGANWCPGRFFALTEILFMVVMVVLRYEISPEEEDWVVPQLDLANMSSIVTPPKGRVPVRITKRESWEGKALVFEI